ncbi:hypothetical protein FSP39_013985 [Pinctada imbricata]|uniref:XK-related protein n=1 Tax=Pinctada imbricata TaxID=66713 RepID=A0AA88XG49_PINIB|nr:hypothetical protein FSP39_013985 [Pinctada imbricata]
MEHGRKGKAIFSRRCEKERKNFMCRQFSEGCDVVDGQRFLQCSRTQGDTSVSDVPSDELMCNAFSTDEIDGVHSDVIESSKDETSENSCLRAASGARESKQNTSHKYPFSYRDGLAVTLSSGFFLFDIISDVTLAETYFIHGRMWECAATSFFIIFPAIFTSILSIVWFCQDRESERISAKWICKMFFSILPTAPLVRNFQYVYHGVCSRHGRDGDQDGHYNEMLYEDRDASMIRMFDAFLESAPQLVLQIYVTFTEKEIDNDPHIRIIRTVAMFASWAAVSWSVTSYYNALRKSLDAEVKDSIESKSESRCSIQREGSIRGSIGYCAYRAYEIGPRIVAIAMFASQFTYFVFAFFIFHWTAMLIWLTCYQKVDFYERWRDNFLFVFVVGFVQIFAFINVGEGSSRFRAIFYYVIFYIENAVFLTLWVLCPSGLAPWTFYVGCAVVPAGFMLHIVFQLLFYVMCHPKDIKNCACCC